MPRINRCGAGTVGARRFTASLRPASYQHRSAATGSSPAAFFRKLLRKRLPIAAERAPLKLGGERGSKERRLERRLSRTRSPPPLSPCRRRPAVSDPAPASAAIGFKRRPCLKVPVRKSRPGFERRPFWIQLLFCALLISPDAFDEQMGGVFTFWGRLISSNTPGKLSRNAEYFNPKQIRFEPRSG